MNAKYFISGAIIVVFLIWGTYSFMRATIPYVSIEKAEKSQHNVQVMGKIDFGMVQYDKEKSRLEFAIYDIEAKDAAAAHRMPVHYYGVVPGNFDQATSVVLKGMPDSTGAFVAEKMLVKCPSKYQGEDGEEYQDMRKHDEAVGESSEA